VPTLPSALPGAPRGERRRRRRAHELLVAHYRHKGVEPAILSVQELRAFDWRSVLRYPDSTPTVPAGRLADVQSPPRGFFTRPFLVPSLHWLPKVNYNFHNIVDFAISVDYPDPAFLSMLHFGMSLSSAPPAGKRYRYPNFTRNVEGLRSTVQPDLDEGWAFNFGAVAFDDLLNALQFHGGLLNPAALRAKNDGTWRRIIDFTFSREGDASLNGSTGPLPTLRMVRTGEFLEFLVAQDDPATYFFCKRDLASGFSQLPLAWPCLPLTIFRCGSNIVVPTTTPFGAAASPILFGRLTFLLMAATTKRAGPTAREWVAGFVDDFGFAAPSRAEASGLAGHFDAACAHFGFRISAKKLATEGAPAQTGTWLGLAYDLRERRVSCTPEQTEKLLAKVNAMLAGSTASHRALQSLFGAMSWATTVRPQAASYTFNTRLAIGAARRQPLRPPPDTLRAEWGWWRDVVIPTFEDTRISRPLERPKAAMDLYADASKRGAGASLREPDGREKGWAALFPTDLLTADINAKELATVAIALDYWAPALQGRHVTVYCDNSSAVQDLEKLQAKSWLMASITASVATWLLRHAVSLRVVHLSSEENTTADALSRAVRPTNTSFSYLPPPPQTEWRRLLLPGRAAQPLPSVASPAALGPLPPASSTAPHGRSGRDGAQASAHNQ